MLTFDDRGISRKYNLNLSGSKMEWRRDAPGFYQRYEAVITDSGSTIIGKGGLSKDGSAWEKDLDLTYTRAA